MSYNQYTQSVSWLGLPRCGTAVAREAWFNDTDMSNKDAARVKEALFDRVLVEYEPVGLFGLESNAAVHRMYRRRNVAFQRGTEPLPSIAELEERGRWSPPAA